MADAELKLILPTVDDRELGDDDWNDVYLAIKSLNAQWRDIGIALGIGADKLDEIEGDNSRTANRLSSVLTAWINQNYDTTKYKLPSWRTLCTALSKAVEKKKFVKDLAIEHGGKLPSGGDGGSTAGGGASAKKPAPSNEEKLLKARPNIGDFTLIKYKTDDDDEQQQLNILDSAADKWEDIAGRLFPTSANLTKNLDRRHRGDPKSCLRELFQDFLSKKLPPEYSRDWKGVIQLLEDVDEAALAEDVKVAVLNKGRK